MDIVGKLHTPKLLLHREGNFSRTPIMSIARYLEVKNQVQELNIAMDAWLASMNKKCKAFARKSEVP